MSIRSVSSADLCVVFAGQASAWQHALADAVGSGQGQFLADLLAQARLTLAPVGREVSLAVPGAVERLSELVSSADVQVADVDMSPAVSMPGIVLAQIASVVDLEEAGVDLAGADAVGHSQGIFGADIVRAFGLHDRSERTALLVQVVARALLFGASVALSVRQFEARVGVSLMWSVRGLCRQAIDEGLAAINEQLHSPVWCAVANGPQSFVLAGSRDSLSAARRFFNEHAALHNRAIESKERGGSLISPVWEELPIGAPFHTPLLEEAVERVVQWACVVDLSMVDVEGCARSIMCKHFDWVEHLRPSCEANKTLLCVGPGKGIVSLTEAGAQGHGVVVADASTVEARDFLCAPGAALPEATPRWSDWMPSLVSLPDGRTVMETSFTRLTGNSPILLAGMTPTTVDADIVAAAANAGYWVEMAGGGQYSVEVFTENKNNLVRQLKPGRMAQFNSMFFDRFMWNLQFGTQKIVSKARAAGAPFNGVTVSAGIPDVEEATALLADFARDGFPYVCFKPGTVEQIHNVLAIADANPQRTIIMQVEDGHAGGHHSWENLDDLLIQTYAQTRQRSNVVLCVGGGIGTPDLAAHYLLGEWSLQSTGVRMPVDGILVGTAAMVAKEAKTTQAVKRMLVDTPGISLSDRGGWVAKGQVRGGMTSGLSHLHADMYEVANSSAACSRLLAEVGSDIDQITSRREEIIDALSRTAKPYFGDITEMTYAQWAHRFVELSYPWTDPTWPDRYLDLLHRIEARLNPADHGEIDTLFTSVTDVEDGHAALRRLEEHYPAATSTLVGARDAAWFITLCRKHHKPMPFVPALDADLARWWGMDTLWQSQDERYPADAVRVIAGPVSVAGIDRMDEPIADLLGRFESACVDAAGERGLIPQAIFSRVQSAQNAIEFVRSVPHIQWNGHLIDNPAYVLGEGCEIRETPDGLELVILCDTYWDQLPEPHPYAVKEVRIPLDLNEDTYTGGCPVVSPQRLPEAVYALLAGVAGIGASSVGGDDLTELPQVVAVGQTTAEGTPAHLPFGTVCDTISLTPEMFSAHLSTTGQGASSQVDQIPSALADALVGTCWPALYASLGTAYLPDGYPVIEGLLNAVHLDHCITLDVPLRELVRNTQLVVRSHTSPLEESASGRIVTVNVELFTPGEVSGSGHYLPGKRVARLIERFAIRGRITSTQAPSQVKEWGGFPQEIAPTPRKFLRRAMVTAPADMTPFAIASGDYNPIHTSTRAAGLVGLDAPLVHGMWLSATAQSIALGAQGASDVNELVGWTYSMYGMVQLEDEVEILVERVGQSNGASGLEVTCRIDEQVVSRGTALLAPPRTAYVYPGQGIQSVGMGAADRAKSAAAREVWERADAHTRSHLGFSIAHIVDTNPTEVTVGDQVLRHPKGVLNLTQFTQVALAVVAYAQTARLAENSVLVEGALYAGHSLGEYTALASCAHIFDLEAVIDVVYSRGSAMHALVPRDESGRSNYRLGALRPNQCGISADEVVGYVAGIAQDSGEFVEIVNFNLAGQQYAVAGTVAGLAALAKDASQRAARAGGKNPYMEIPGIDVPFHSSVLRDGVPAFAQTLEAALPQRVDVQALVGRYIPNLVARPFELTRDFAQSIVDCVPAEKLADLLADGDRFEQWAASDPGSLARLLLIELLSWQFASPVRWIETQALLMCSPSVELPAGLFGLGVQQIIEVGLASAPTLANLAAKTLALPQFDSARIQIHNVERDEAAVYATDSVPVPPRETFNDEAPAAELPAEAAPASAPAPTPEVTASTNLAPAASNSGGPVRDLSFGADHALMVLFAWQTKLRIDDIQGSDTTDTLTNGVSSRRNQLLMDMSAELGVASIDGAAEADVATLKVRGAQAAPTYQPFGAVLSEVIRTKMRALVSSAGLKPAAIGERVTGVWGLPESWVAPVEAEILLETREGDSVRGGTLGALAQMPTGTKAQVTDLIDAAVNRVAGREGVAVSLSSGASSGGGVVDSAALDAYAAQVTGQEGVLAAIARTISEKLGLVVPPPQDCAEDLSTLVAAVDAELGSQWMRSVTPAFTPERVVLFDDRWASAREDLARAASAGTPIDPARVRGTGEVVATQAQWWADHTTGQVRDSFLAAVQAARQEVRGQFADDIAVVTGAAPGSIAGSIVASLLAGGATVVMTASRVNADRVDYARQMYAQNATPGAALYLVQANLSSFRDVDALVEWVSSEQTETRGNLTIITKPALIPTLLFPFAAPSVRGSLADAGPEAEAQTRLLLWSVERLIAGLGALRADASAIATAHDRLHVVLPGSPNRGTFGGDGAYGEVKAAFDAILNKWSSESGWPAHVTFAQARIGWVSGTHLMSGNDALVPAAQAAGIHVYTPAEITTELLALCTQDSRQEAAQAPLDVDLTGGLSEANISLPDMARDVAAQLAQEALARSTVEAEPVRIRALPNLANPTLAPSVQVNEVSTALEDMVVIVGTGEVSAWGSGRTRHQAEFGIHRDGSVDLTAAGVLELAWMMDLVRWSEDPAPGWYDAAGAEVPESEIYDRFRDEVAARCGVRTFPDDSIMVECGSNDVATVYLDKDITFSVATESEANDYVLADPSAIITQVEDEWLVTKKAGTVARVPKRATLTRTVGGALPNDFNPAHWGIPATMVDSLDRIASWNLVTAVDAFLSSGFTPAELLQAVHPSEVSSTQGTGIGGMESLRKVFLSRFLGEDRPQDILQEALPNVVAAHVMQSYVGGYGQMIHPVAACATAAVSVEEGVDKILLGKAQFVLAGGIDDISVESLTGFGDMNATAPSAAMAAKGIHERFYSRANDRRRGGFVEAAGGGTVLLARADLAAELGLPVLAVVAHAASYADGSHTSIPAPGIGALGAARGGTDSAVARSLRALGLTPDDVRVVSKHDTSTNANDPNESELHSLLWRAIGRTPGNPMFVISQKTLTGHAKGGAALFQIAGLTEVLRTGRIPGNASLDCVDPDIAPKALDLVWLRSPLALGEGAVKAAVLTSLGFGHVAAVVVLAHPACFEAALGASGGSVEAWRKRAQARLTAGARRLEAGMIGREALFESAPHRRLPEQGAHDAEIQLLLDPAARLGLDGIFPAAH